jgi:exodeoxyribonuclease VII large subunit
MFKGNAMRLRFRPENGMKVIAMGKISVFPRDGAYQLYCTAMAMDGVGDLYAAFEQLKRKLSAQGLFDEAHKQKLPQYPGVIGIVTSSAGAAKTITTKARTKAIATTYRTGTRSCIADKSCKRKNFVGFTRNNRTNSTGTS